MPNKQYGLGCQGVPQVPQGRARCPGLGRLPHRTCQSASVARLAGWGASTLTVLHPIYELNRSAPGGFRVPRGERVNRSGGPVVPRPESSAA